MNREQDTILDMRDKTGVHSRDYPVNKAGGYDS